MTYKKIFTWLTAMVGGICVANASVAGHSRFVSEATPPISQDPLPQPAQKDTIAFLTPEELALLVEVIPNEPNDVIADRLSCLQADIPLVFNDYVRNFIDYFTIRNRKYTRTMLARENVYFPLFEQYLQKYNMPDELKYLAIVESGLNPKAASHAGAVGLWQFIRATGKEYGLDYNNHLDERMDPEKSTDAAMRFLRRLHAYYGDWELALAAYNCGQGNVNKAIRRAGGGKKTFWEIFPYLPRETRGYVPSMTAVRYAMNYAAEHNIFSDSLLYEPEVAHLQLTQPTDLQKLAEAMFLDVAELMALNPELKKPELPEGLRNYKLRVPAAKAVLFANTTDKNCLLLAAAPTPAKAQEPAQVLVASAKKENAKPQEQKQNQEQVIYVVQPGDNLTQIAKRHAVTVEDLKAWNSLSSHNLMPGQKLQLLQQQAVALATAQEAKPAAKQEQQLIYHVQPGDTLWTISRKYNGLTVEQIKKMNKLKTNAIKPGQKLILG